jgi:hypothetical protein
LAIIVFLSANLHAHSYTQRFPKGLHKGRALKKGIENNEREGREGREGESGGNCDTKGLYFRTRAELDKEEKNTRKQTDTKSNHLQS